MSKYSLSHLGGLDVDGVQIVPEGQAVRIRGKMTSRQPDPSVQSFFRKIHDEAQKLKVASIEVDVTGLLFVNSSAIRLFVDWAMWAKGGADAPIYQLVFHIKEGITWQRMTLAALTSLAPAVVRIEAKA